LFDGVSESRPVYELLRVFGMARSTDEVGDDLDLESDNSWESRLIAGSRIACAECVSTDAFHDARCMTGYRGAKKGGAEAPPSLGRKRPRLWKTDAASHEDLVTGAPYLSQCEENSIMMVIFPG
jgi:hypothetical protein